MPFLTLPPLPFGFLAVMEMLLLLPLWRRDVRGGKTAASIEFALLTFEVLMRHDLLLGGGVWATRHFWYWT